MATTTPKPEYQDVTTAPKDQLFEDKKTYNSSSDDGDDTSIDNEAQAGVQAMEAISVSWTKWSLIAAYTSLMFMANAVSLEQQTTFLYAPFATSSFLAHSLLATVYVVQGTVNAIIKPTIAKVSDVFGRFESFCFIIVIYTVGYIQQAASNNVQAFASAQIFYSAGNQGLQVLQQIFVADTTDLLNRALFSTIFDLPFLWTVWAGGPIAAKVLATTTWRWGYGMWAIILPVCFIPLAVSLFVSQKKAKRSGRYPANPFKGMNAFGVVKYLWLQLDVFGLMLLAAFLALLLLPLTLGFKAKGGFSNPSMIAMLVIGFVCLMAFPFWERSPKLAPHAFFPPELFKNRTVVCGVAIGFFYFMAFYLSIFPYFSSYLLIVQGTSVTAAGHITQTFSFTSTVSSIIVSFFIKYTAHYKYFITFGACIYLMGMGLLIRYRAEGVSIGTLVGCQIAVGMGGGLLNVPAQLGVQASVRHTNVAAATAAFLTITEIGGAVGSAISGAVWTRYIPMKLSQYAPPSIQNQTTLIFGNVTLAATGWPMGSPERIAINRAYQETMTILLTIAVCMCIPLIPLSLFMKNYKLNQVDQGVKGKVIGDSNRDVHVAERRASVVDNEKNNTTAGTPIRDAALDDHPSHTDPKVPRDLQGSVAA